MSNLLTFLVNSLWQVPLVTLVAALIVWLLRNRPAAHRHTVWVAALVAAVLLPLASITTTTRRVIPVTPLAPPMETVGAAQPSHAAAAAPRQPLVADPITVPFATRTAQMVVAAYGLFLLYRLMLLGVAWMRTVRIRRAARPRQVSAPVQTIWTRCLRVFGLSAVDLLSSPTVPGPLMAGAWRRSVIVPDSLLEETSEEVLSTALGHEAAHAARHDFLVNLVCEVLYLPIAFNPVAWILRRGIQRTREMACDEMVTSRLLDAGAYARSIVSLAAGMRNPARPNYSLGVFDGDILEERLRRLMARRTASLRYGRLVLVACLSALAVCAIVASGLALSAHAQTAGRTELLAGVQAYNAGDFQSAIQHLEAAVHAEPSNLIARLHLANSYIAAFRVHPDAWLTQSAHRQYEDILTLDPTNSSAIVGVASTDGPNEYAHVHDLLIRLTSADPKNATAFYMLAVKDWAYAYPLVQKVRAAAGIPMQAPAAPLPDAAARATLRDQVKVQLDEGVNAARAALTLDPASSDAMAYLNLLYRLQAYIQDDPAQSKVLLAQADDLVGQALAAKRLAQKSAASTNVTPDAAPPLTSWMVPVLPPPPPPPPGYKGNAAAEVATTVEPAPWWEVATPSQDAATLVAHLRSLGFPAAIMNRAGDDQSHVVVGPYRDAAALQQAKSKLEAEGFTPKLR